MTRNILIWFYNSLPFADKESFFIHVKEYVIDKDIKFSQDVLSLRFNKGTIRIPVSTCGDIGKAFAILGHDVDVKETYDELINYADIKCFYDVGANFGHHSLLLSSCGVSTICFEPNIECKEELFEHLSINGLKNCVFNNVAVGDEQKQAHLFFPVNATWLGKIDNESFDDLDKDITINKVKVDVIRIDDYVLNNPMPDLIKIDTEGFEINVLRGAEKTISKSRPFVIFENLGKLDVFDSLLKFFLRHKYQVVELPIQPNKSIIVAAADSGFLQGNFLAYPEEAKHIIMQIRKSKG